MNVKYLFSTARSDFSHFRACMILSRVKPDLRNSAQELHLPNSLFLHLLLSLSFLLLPSASASNVSFRLSLTFSFLLFVLSPLFSFASSLLSFSLSLLSLPSSRLSRLESVLLLSRLFLSSFLLSFLCFSLSGDFRVDRSVLLLLSLTF